MKVLRYSDLLAYFDYFSALQLNALFEEKIVFFKEYYCCLRAGWMGRRVLEKGRRFFYPTQFDMIQSARYFFPDFTEDRHRSEGLV